MDKNFDPQEQTAEIAGFIAKTFDILNNQDFSRIIYWGSNGAQFVIKDINKFQQIVLPKYFRHNKINSFIRQLNMYGFHKSRKDHSKSVFSHPLFQKNREDLLVEIKRKIRPNDDQNSEKFQTPIKTQKIVKEEMQTAVTGKRFPELKEKAVSSLKQLNILEGGSSSFMKLFESKENFFSKNQLNFSLNKVSQNCIGQAKSELDEKNCQIVSIENGIEDKKQRQQDIAYLQSISKFQNPSCFFNSFIERN